jgi:hypothetical protein
MLCNMYGNELLTCYIMLLMHSMCLLFIGTAGTRSSWRTAASSSSASPPPVVEHLSFVPYAHLSFVPYASAQLLPQ